VSVIGARIGGPIGTHRSPSFFDPLRFVPRQKMARHLLFLKPMVSNSSGL